MNNTTVWRASCNKAFKKCRISNHKTSRWRCKPANKRNRSRNCRNRRRICRKRSARKPTPSSTRSTRWSKVRFSKASSWSRRGFRQLKRPRSWSSIWWTRSSCQAAWSASASREECSTTAPRTGSGSCRAPIKVPARESRKMSTWSSWSDSLNL